MLHPHQKAEMGPRQFATRCVANLFFGEGQVKLPEVSQIGGGKAFAKLTGQPPRKIFEHPLILEVFLVLVRADAFEHAARLALKSSICSRLRLCLR